MAPVFGDEGDPLAGEIERGRSARGWRCLRGAASASLGVHDHAARRERDHERRR